MKRTLNYLLIIVILSGAIVSFWVYEKYFKPEAPKLLLFKVERGGIQETVKVRGEVVPEKDFDLEFPFSGTVKEILARDGQQVKSGAPLLRLETTDFELEIKKLNAALAESEANLDKLLAGPIKEDLRVSQTKIENAKTSQANAASGLIDSIRDAYTKSDDAVRNRVDQFLSSPRSSSPQLTFTLSDSQLKSDIEWGRFVVETKLTAWDKSLAGINISPPDLKGAQGLAGVDLNAFNDEAVKNLDAIKSFLDKIALAVNSLTANSTLTQTKIDGWRADIAAARVNLNTTTASLTAAEEKLKTAGSNLKLAEDELTLKRAAARTEDVTIAEAQIETVKSQIAIIREKIGKSTLYAPGDAKVVKIGLEKGEFFKPGQIAVSLATAGHKIQAEISELEIGKVREGDGNAVKVRLDAFPDLALRGKIISVEAREIVKDGDKYYRVNIYMEPHGAEIRSGMNADLTILVSAKENALKIPELAVYKKDGEKFVLVIENGGQKEVKIETGISDGKSVEVTKGLVEGQTIAAAE